MAASLPRSSSLLLGLLLVLACDRAPEASTTKAFGAEGDDHGGPPKKASPSDPAAKPDMQTETKSDMKMDTNSKAPASAGTVLANAPADPMPIAAPAPAPADAPVAVPTLAGGPGLAAVAEGAVVDGLSIVTHTVIAPKRTGDAKEDYWTQYQVWGEITNHSSEVMESVTGNITFHDGAGAMIGIDSIGTASKEDVGDRSPGETILASVNFVQPGQTVPFHFMRNLDAIKGEIASHRVTPRSGLAAKDPPKAVALDVKESFEGEDFSRKRVFTGTIRNDGDGGCRAPSFVVAFLDAAGKVAHIDSFDASDDLQKVLAKGESMPFTGGVFVTGDDAWREAAAVKTYVSCMPIY